jgi:hypothetical protein
MREIDALVAEHVMGWCWRTWSRPAYAAANMAFPYWASERRCVMVPPDWVSEQLMPLAVNGEERLYDVNPPHYTADIAAAWTVVEKMLKEGVECEMYVNLEGRARARFLGRNVTGLGYADTAPMAICIAALKAHGITPDQPNGTRNGLEAS